MPLSDNCPTIFTLTLNYFSLLYVENYHKDQTLNAWIFDSFSPSCGAELTAASFGLIFIFVFAGIRVYYVRKNEEPSRKVVLGLAIGSTIWAFIAFVMACVFTAGLNQTCKQFEQSGKSCGAVFGDGFFANDVSQIYKKNINTINAALGASWFVFIGFSAYAGFEWYNYRFSSMKWW